jgi:membrane protein EpsK
MRKNKLLLNLIFNFLSLAISIGLSFWITPFIVNTIGSESYGFVPLTQQLVNYMTIITVSVTPISGRFFTIAKRQDNLSLAQDYFSSALFAGIAGSSVLAAILLPCALYIDKLLNIPDYLINDVRTSFLIYCVIFFISFITSIFNVGAFSNNKLYITSTINIINIIVKTLVTVCLLLVFAPRIWYISLGTLISSFAAMVLTIFTFMKIEPAIKILKLNISKLKEILMSGIWVSLSEIGVILFLQIDLLVANWNLGAGLAGEYAVVLSLPSILRTLSGAIISIFVPTVISFFAMGEIDNMTKYVNNAVKYTGILLSLPIGIICGLGSTVLSLWVNPHYTGYGLVLAILSIHLSINLPVQVIMSVQTAFNKLRMPALVTLVMGAINFILAFSLTKYFNMGVMGIALSGGVVLTAKNAVFTPLYVAKITGQKWNSYLSGILKPAISTCFVAGLSFLLNHFYCINNFSDLIMVALVISFAYLVFVYFTMLNKYERIFLIKKAGELIGKSKHHSSCI